MLCLGKEVKETGEERDHTVSQWFSAVVLCAGKNCQGENTK